MAATTEDTLAFERRQRPKAAIAALVGAVATLAAAVFSGLLFGDAPRSWFGESVGRSVEPGALGQAPSLQVPFYEYYADRSALVLLGSAIRALGWVATGYALFALATATLNRTPRFPRAALYLPLFAGGLSAAATLLVDGASKLAVDSFLDGPRTVEAAQEVTASSALVLGQFIGLAGSLAASLSFVLVGLNAMRAGLLTRFLGILAIIVGVLLVFPIGSPIPVVQCFWLAALALLFSGRWPGGGPPAWTSGQAEPWPSAAEVREQRMREQSGGAAPAAAPAAVAAGPERRPASGKRKRKRRS